MYQFQLIALIECLYKRLTIYRAFIMSQQNAFDQKKNAILAEITSVQPDLSPKGTIDELCLPIMHLINSHVDMVTTSSCSGRISIFAEGTKIHNGIMKVGGKGEGGKWLYVSHDSDKVHNWLTKLEFEGANIIETNSDEVNSRLDGSKRYILFKYEPFILHVKCRDFNSASKLYNVAMSCGFRESGIGSNNLVGIRINIKLDVPIGYIDEDSNELKLFVPRTYIELLNKITSNKFEENARKIQDLFDAVKKEIVDEPVSSTNDTKIETKEERRERKIKEGLKRQREAQLEKLKKLNLAETP